VLYELGLAYSIGQKIITVRHRAAPFGRDLAAYFNAAGYPSYQYNDLAPIQMRESELVDLLWRIPNPAPDLGQGLPYILFYENLPSGIVDPSVGHTDEITQDVFFPFAAHIVSDIRLAIERTVSDINSVQTRTDSIVTHLDRIRNLALPVTATVSAPFDDIRRQVDGSYCAIFRTGKDCDPMTYFWLGYAHGRGGNAIPITTLQSASEVLDDLAFDIRALRHMTFVSTSPHTVRSQLDNTLREMIVSDFSEWSRKHFWDHLLSPHGEVHLFTGSLHNAECSREMVGDWDLRTASEVTSYLTRHQYRCEIESPVYGPERAGNRSLSDYLDILCSMLRGKNCILLGSPDVNPFTELVLGRAYNVPMHKLFGEPLDLNEHYIAIVVTKERNAMHEGDPIQANRAFYHRPAVDSSAALKRGFASKRLRGGKLVAPHVGLDNNTNTFHAFGHLMILRNPFDDDQSQPHFIVVLNGATGPATFAISHALTAGAGKEFTVYEAEFDPNSASELFLRQLLDRMARSESKGVECIVQVTVGSLTHPEHESAWSAYDWRHIMSWEVAPGGFDPPIAVIE
jgi:hypothetical protein